MSNLKKLLKKALQFGGYRLIKTSFLESHFYENNNPHFRKSGDLNPLEQLFYKYIDDDFFFIQIGANNGKRYDPIHHLITREKQHVSGIAIEPVGEYFKELQQTYGSFSKIKLLRKAIHNTEDSAVIFKIDPTLADIEEHLKGMSSFNINNLLKDGVLRNNILEERVPCISLMELVNAEKIKTVHLLQIDTEGYDLEIITSIDFNVFKPLVINFEHRWEYKLVAEQELLAVFEILIKQGYQISLNGNDALAYLQI